MKKIAILDNIIQAQILESMHKKEGIPHVMKTYHDSAYDGLFRIQKGWGHVEAPEEHEPEILAMLEHLETQNP